VICNKCATLISNNNNNKAPYASIDAEAGVSPRIEKEKKLIGLVLLFAPSTSLRAKFCNMVHIIYVKLLNVVY
jgi:hypothetical protein